MKVSFRGFLELEFTTFEWPHGQCVERALRFRVFRWEVRIESLSFGKVWLE